MDITKDEELQAKEFLKRAEIITMRKDLQGLREADALKERDKIVKGNTVEAQQAESEKQQIFILESQRLGLEKQIDVLEQEKESSLALEKNQILIGKRAQEAKLGNIIADEQKIEKEEKFISEKEKTSNIPSEKKSLEERRGELEAKRQEMEKKRWAVEKEIKNMENGVEKIDADYLQITKEKNSFREKIKAIDMSLRDIYSKIIKRVEDKKRGLLEQQKLEAAKREQLSSEKKEKIQREQWTHSTDPGQVPREKEFLKSVPDRTREKIFESTQAEEDQRKKFLEDIEKQATEEQNKNKTNRPNEQRTN